MRIVRSGLVLVMLACLPVFAQQITGSIRGTVLDQSGYFGATKDIRVAEGKQLQFRAELFNVLNHTNFRLPDSDISSPPTVFNHILAARDPRLVQFALKFAF